MQWEFFWRFLFSKRAGSVVRRIAWLSVVALTVSVAALILVLSVMTALNKNMQRRLLSVDPHVVIEFDHETSSSQIEAEIAKQNLFLPEWKVYPYEAQDVILRTVEGRFRGAYARGLTVEGLNHVFSGLEKQSKGALIKKESSPTVATGSVLKESERLESSEILIGVDLAYMLGVFEGDALTLVPPEGLLLPASEAPKFEKVRVREIIASNIQDVDAQIVFYIRGKTLSSLSQSASVRRGLEIWLPDFNRADSLKADLQKKLQGMPLKVMSWKDRNSALFLSLRLEKLVIGIFLSIASIIAGFSLVIVLGLLISQKRREIGLLQAIGLGRRRCFKLFQGIGLRLTGMGIVMGAMIGGGLSLYLEHYPLKVLPDIYYDAEIPAYMDSRLVFIVAVLGLLLSYVGGILVTKPLASIHPSELLRIRK